MGSREKSRCWGTGDPLMEQYHDTEWGVPLHDDLRLFEFLVLEGMQSGLSWRLILNKREGFRRAFDGFDPQRIARYGDREVSRLLSDAGIVRNRLKIHGAINNAARFLEVQEEYGSFDRYIWRFVDGKPIRNRLESLSGMPAHTELSDRISADLKKRGFKFVGSTVVYSHMQATGMVNDHLVGCFRHRQLTPRGASARQQV
jgi:DNA-3-methyladenine glycosylase I